MGRHLRRPCRVRPDAPSFEPSPGRLHLRSVRNHLPREPQPYSPCVPIAVSNHLPSCAPRAGGPFIPFRSPSAAHPQSTSPRKDCIRFWIELRRISWPRTGIQSCSGRSCSREMLGLSRSTKKTDRCCSSGARERNTVAKASIRGHREILYGSLFGSFKGTHHGRFKHHAGRAGA